MLQRGTHILVAINKTIFRDACRNDMLALENQFRSLTAHESFDGVLWDRQPTRSAQDSPKLNAKGLESDGLRGGSIVDAGPFVVSGGVQNQTTQIINVNPGEPLFSTTRGAAKKRAKGGGHFLQGAATVGKNNAHA